MRWITASVATLAFAVTSCQNAQVATKRSKAEEEKEKSILDETKTTSSSFTDTINDGRKVEFATWSDVYSKIDFTRLHPKTQFFYQVSSPSAVQILIEEDRREILWKFTNFQDSISVKDAIAGIKQGCSQEGFTSLLACINEAIQKSGAVVFEMKQKLGNPLNPNDENHIRDALYGLLGATFIDAPAPDGTTEMRMTTACVACHNASYSKVSGSNTTLFVDLRGDHAGADALRNRDAMTTWEEFKTYVANPSDPIWGISAEAKAVGYMAAQYMKLKDQYAHNYGYDEDDIRQNAHRANVKSVVDAGWVSAFANWITTSRAWNGAYLDGMTNDQKVAYITEKTTALRIIQERDNLLRPWSVLAPLRSQRSVLFAPSSTNALRRGLHTPDNFALDYMQYQGMDADARSSALPYLLSATAISFVFPGIEDSALSQSWYGLSPGAADEIVKRELPRTVLKNYLSDASKYHQARYIISQPTPKTHVQTITAAEVNLGNSLQQSTCFNCHKSAVADLSLAKLTTNCYGKSECIADAPVYTETLSDYFADTPSSTWATSVMSQMETAPEAFRLNFYTSVTPNSSIKSRPARIPLLRRQALGLWSYPSYAAALYPNNQRQAPGYGLLSSKLSLDRTVPFRTVALTFDFDGNGVIGQEKMYCAQSQTFDLDGDGVKETSCFDAIKVLSGGTPRPIGQSDAIDAVHSGVVTFPTTTANRNALAKLTAAYADGAFNVKWTDNTVTYVKIFPMTSKDGCMSEDTLCGYGVWRGFQADGSTGAGTGSSSGGSGGMIGDGDSGSGTSGSGGGGPTMPGF